MEFNVYLCTPIESIQVAAFRFRNEAETYVALSIVDKRPLDPADTDNGNNYYWMEIYRGEPISEDGMVSHDPIFTSIKVYTD